MKNGINLELFYVVLLMIFTQSKFQEKNMRKEYSSLNAINVVILNTTIVLFSFLNSFGQEYRYKDPGLPVEERVTDLMQRMTLQEKIGQMTMCYLQLCFFIHALKHSRIQAFKHSSVQAFKHYNSNCFIMFSCFSLNSQ